MKYNAHRISRHVQPLKDVYQQLEYCLDWRSTVRSVAALIVRIQLFPIRSHCGNTGSPKPCLYCPSITHCGNTGSNEILGVPHLVMLLPIIFAYCIHTLQTTNQHLAS